MTTPEDIHRLQPARRKQPTQLTREQRVHRRNRRHPWPPAESLGVRLRRHSPQGRHGRPHREEHHSEVRDDLLGSAWHQPGRSFGPSPLGPEHPKQNKVTDSDGNPRIMPLTPEQRIARYHRGPGQRLSRAPERDVEGRGITPRERAALLGITLRQRRRLSHKNNHARAPFSSDDD